MVQCNPVAFTDVTGPAAILTVTIHNTSSIFITGDFDGLFDYM